MLTRIIKVIGIGFSVLWMIFTFLEYWQYHEETRKSIAYFQFPELVLVLILLGAAFVWIFSRFKEHGRIRYFTNGLGITLLSCLIGLISMNGFFAKNLGSGLNFVENINLVGTLLAVAGGTYFIVLIAYASGRTLGKIFGITGPTAYLGLLYIGIGIIFLVSLLFILGIFNLLLGFILWPLLLLVLFVSWRSAWHFVKISLWQPVPGFSRLNPLGLSVFYLLLVMVSLNFVAVARPFPIGFDAMTQYVNLAYLISDYHGLVQGYGAYNWSLFMSLGYLLFNQTSITLSLSFLGGILSLFALYRLSRRWLDENYSFFPIFLFYSIPIISWLSYRDMKIDLSLLFYSLLIILALMDWLAPQTEERAKKPKASPTRSKKKKGEKLAREWSTEILALQRWIQKITPNILSRHSQLVLIGVLTGFAIGIKFSALILLLALLPAIAYAHGNQLAFAGSLTVVLALVLLARFDTQAALRPMHLLADQLQWVLLLAGAGLTFFLFLKEKTLFTRVLTMSLIYIFLSGLSLSPWIIKNAVEAKSFSVSSLTSGKSANPSPTVLDIKEKYQNWNNGQ